MIPRAFRRLGDDGLTLQNYEQFFVFRPEGEGAKTTVAVQ
jgi:hypothetical protein